MSEKLIDVKEVALNNNCPECYNTDGLRLTFRQKIVENQFYKRTTTKINHEMSCNQCKLIIYPERWTDDIERVVDYHQKAFIPKKQSTYLKKTFWITVFGTVIIVGAILFLAYYNSDLIASANS